MGVRVRISLAALLLALVAAPVLAADAADAKKAASELERYRDDLAVAGETAPFKDGLPKGAYSDLAGPGLGDEAVWSDVNGSLAVRKGSLTLQFTAPKGKLDQVKASAAVTKKL